MTYFDFSCNPSHACLPQNQRFNFPLSIQFILVLSSLRFFVDGAPASVIFVLMLSRSAQTLLCSRQPSELLKAVTQLLYSLHCEEGWVASRPFLKLLFKALFERAC